MPFSFRYRTASATVTRIAGESVDDGINRLAVAFSGAWTASTRLTTIPHATLSVSDTTISMTALQWQVKSLQAPLSPLADTFYWVEQGSQTQTRSYSMPVSTAWSDSMLTLPHGVGSFEFVRMFACSMAINAITAAVCTSCADGSVVVGGARTWHLHAANQHFGGLQGTGSYRYFTIYDWDSCLGGTVGIMDLGTIPPFWNAYTSTPAWPYLVDGHVKWEALGGGRCRVAESTGTYADPTALGFYTPVGTEADMSAIDLGSAFSNTLSRYFTYCGFYEGAWQYGRIFGELTEITPPPPCGNAVNVSLWFKNLKVGTTYRATLYFGGCEISGTPTCGSDGECGASTAVASAEIVFTAEYWAEVISGRGGDADIEAVVTSLEAEAAAIYAEHPENGMPGVHVNDLPVSVPVVEGSYVWFDHFTLEEVA